MDGRLGEMAATGLHRTRWTTLIETTAVATRECSISRRSCRTDESALCPHNPDIVAQLHHAVTRSWRSPFRTCCFDARGIGQSRCQGLDCAADVGARMAGLLGWSSRRLDAELDAYHQCIERSVRFRSR
jgi:hypothetical protein